MEEKILEKLNKTELDLRITRNARFMDQKVTPDVLCIISDCVIQFISKNKEIDFTTTDIWTSEYANQTVIDIFNKPDLQAVSARNEYDKFFAQPLKTLSYAGILSEKKEGNKNVYSVNDYEILEYLSVKERNSLNFLVIYLKQVLRDSGFWAHFESFFKNNKKSEFNILKEKYENFIIENTAINGTTEVRRIFTKVLNPLSYNKKLFGTKRGSMSTDIIGYDELMYNRKNWRDIKKNRGETRQEYELRAKNKIKSYTKFTIEKAKRLIRSKYMGVSEVNDEWSTGEATQAHHIFPRSDYREIESYLENLILLTPTQHFTKAHPNNNTRKINRDYQLICLLTKSSEVKKSTEIIKDGFYSKEDFIYVLNIGINPERKFKATDDFNKIEQFLASEYEKA